MTISEISFRLNNLQFDSDVINLYDEPHRFYHTLAHIEDILKQLHDSDLLKHDELFLAAVFHDIVYNPQSNTNEEDSANLFLNAAKSSSLTTDQKEHIRQLILDTKHHKPTVKFSEEFIKADLAILNSSFDKLITYEKQIFKEFQFVDYKDYKPKRIEVLKHFNTSGNLNHLIDYVHSVEPKIAVFAGSFNPFHKGHYNVLKKAERLFDKVIIAFGKNPDKTDRSWPIPKTISNRQQTEYHGLLTDHIEAFGYDVTVVRGLRNSTDFQYEQNQYRYIQELKPDIKIINIFCDKEFEHISSSGIRTLEKYNKHQSYLLD
ncbi:MAG: adenylyltransferase/cytidyltransferase family protein [Bacteroidetes bacterium]|jgi:pantetheine-phosphate adenylyltransferase|nr:adenylyltransferase/cytidyltransferase family protein [Bacteroidota bacterium]MDF2450385.1 adenylyltransferase/cytidyltransferase family protein [Bacteroidota bacterium]